MCPKYKTVKEIYKFLKDTEEPYQLGFKNMIPFLTLGKESISLNQPIDPAGRVNRTTFYSYGHTVYKENIYINKNDIPKYTVEINNFILKIIKDTVNV